jgi:hypothetical protein
MFGVFIDVELSVLVIFEVLVALAIVAFRVVLFIV